MRRYHRSSCRPTEARSRAAGYRSRAAQLLLFGDLTLQRSAVQHFPVKRTSARNGLIEDHDWGPRTEAHWSILLTTRLWSQFPLLQALSFMAGHKDARICHWRRFLFEAEVFDTEPSTPRLKTALLSNRSWRSSARTRESKSPKGSCADWRLLADVGSEPRRDFEKLGR